MVTALSLHNTPYAQRYGYCTLSTQQAIGTTPVFRSDTPNLLLVVWVKPIDAAKGQVWPLMARTPTPPKSLMTVLIQRNYYNHDKTFTADHILQIPK